MKTLQEAQADFKHKLSVLIDGKSPKNPDQVVAYLSYIKDLIELGLREEADKAIVQAIAILGDLENDKNGAAGDYREQVIYLLRNLKFTERARELLQQKRDWAVRNPQAYGARVDEIDIQRAGCEFDGGLYEECRAIADSVRVRTQPELLVHAMAGVYVIMAAAALKKLDQIAPIQESLIKFMASEIKAGDPHYNNETLEDILKGMPRFTQELGRVAEAKLMNEQSQKILDQVKLSLGK